MLKFATSILIFFFCLSLNAQIGYDKLDKFSTEEIAAITWEAGKDLTNNYPKDWENQSAIYLQWKNMYDIEKNSKRIQMVQLIHRKVKILDDSALDYFSEIYLPATKRSFEFKRSTVKSGVRVIKTNGEIDNIKSDEFLKNKDDNSKKLAIPGLEKGDILEYFIYVIDTHNSQYMNSTSSEGLNPILFDHFPVQSEYPILHFNYQIQTDKKFRTHLITNSENLKVKSSFRDPSLKVYSVEGKQITYEESQIWTSAYNDLAYLKSMVKLDSKAPDKIIGSVEDNQIINHMATIDSQAGLYFGPPSEHHRKVIKKSKSDFTPYEELMDFYYIFRHLYINKPVLSNLIFGRGALSSDSPYSNFILSLIPKLEDIGINHSILAILPRDEGDIDHVFSNLEFSYVIKVRDDDKYLYFPMLDPYSTYGVLPPELENSDAYEVRFENGRIVKKAKKIKTPSSSYSDNMVMQTSKVKIDLDNEDKVNISTDIKIKGHSKANLILPLTYWYDEVVESDKKYLLKGTGKMFSLSEMNLKSKASFNEIIKEKKAQLKEQIEQYAKNQFSEDITNISNTNSEFVEDKKNTPYLDIHFDLTYNDILKKVGPNYILKLGKLVGGQIDVSEVDRRYDVHMNYARGYTYDITIDLPEGFDPIGLEDLDQNIDNATGIYQVSHTLQGNELTFKFKKAYKNNFQKKSEWPMMVEFLEPANTFETKEILLKKK